jgi:hypothetical protein
MTVSVVLRLVERALASGRLAGEARLVESGETAVIRDAEELVAFLRGADTVTGRPDRETRSQGEGK